MKLFSLKEFLKSFRKSRVSRSTEPSGRRRTARKFTHPAVVESLEPRQVLSNFTVTTASDVVDGSDGLLSLREAVTLAEADAVADTITFGDGSAIAGGTNFTDSTPDTITLTGGQMKILNPVTITGSGASLLTLDGNDASRIFQFGDPIPFSAVFQATLSGVTLTRGRANQGGAINVTSTDLTLEDSVLTGNTATSAGGALWTYGGAQPGIAVTIRRTEFTGNHGGSRGGAISALDNTLTLEDSVLSGNDATDGGALWADGFRSTVTIRRSQLTGNVASRLGGAIYNEDTGGVFTIEDSTISGNRANGTGSNHGSGGGVYFYDPDDSVLISRSTISDNIAAGGGGGIFLYNIDGGAATLTIENSTISGNTAANGGGVYFYKSSGSDFVLRSSTIANNTATSQGGGLLFNLGGSATISNSILANNTANGSANDFLLRSGALGTNVNYSLIEALPSGTLDTSLTTGNIVGQDPLLGPLLNNGGLTKTHALLSGSPALNVGVVSSVLIDQRGFTRGTLPDIGAFEVVYDFGDAPDTGAGTSAGNYETLLANGGPRHAIVGGLKLGVKTDGEADATQNATATGDDTGADDEDGGVSPLTDLQFTIGAAPTVTLRATNTIGTAATLYGWVDYNNNGVFDNATERTSVAVPDATSNGLFTLMFPTVPAGFTGTTYARFRLSTDVAAANATGTAGDGEVEDYAVTITTPSSGTVKPGGATKIATGGANVPTLADFDVFGSSVANLGDLDGDGVADLAVGAPDDDTGGTYRGAVHILFLNASGTVKSSTKIASATNGGPSLANGDSFGRSVANLGDLDGDGVADLAVGAFRDNTGGNDRGAVHILFLNANGTVKSSTKIASATAGGPTLADSDLFGISVANLGDLDGDGVTDLAVGADSDDTGGGGRGAVHILFLNTSGTVKSSTKIANGTGGGPTLANYDLFGRSVANLGDLDGDGLNELVVGSVGDDTGGSGRGAVHVLFLNASGTVKSSAKIASGANGGPSLANFDAFGSSVANVGDLDGDGVSDLAVGAYTDDTAGSDRGAVHILFLNASGTAKSSTKIASGTGGGPTLANFDKFGSSVASLGDLDGDGVTDLAVGAANDDTGGTDRGAIHILRLSLPNQAPTAVALQNTTTTLPENTSTAAAIKLADIVVTDDALGTNTLSLTGADAAFFEIVGTELRLKSGTVLNFEAKSSYGVTINVDDTTVGSTPDLTTSVTLTITDVNEAPTAVALQNTITTLPENTSTAIAIKLADIVVTDDALGTNGLSLSGADAAVFEIVAGALRLKAGTVLNFEAKSSYSVTVNVDDTTVGATPDAATTYTLTITNTNDAPVLDNSGSPFVVLGVGARQSLVMQHGVLVSELLARGAGGAPISDQDSGALDGIALTAIDRTYGTFQYTLVSSGPSESDWIDVEAAGAISATSALLLPTTARLRFKTSLVPHHEAGPQFLALESKLDAGLTFRAWDRTTGAAGGRASTTTNGGATAFSTAEETSRVYFEARLWRHYNRVAGVNVDTLQAEFEEIQRLANLYNPDAFEDRSTDSYTGFSILMSAVPELSTIPVYRLYFGVQFNDDGTETDMGYRYLTTNPAEVEELELNGPADKRAERAGTYFRELGINSGTGIIGYIFAVQQPGTSVVTQIYRTDLVNKPTRPGGTPEGGTPTSFRLQESGDHVYTTNIPFESSRTGVWRTESIRGFARELSSNTGGAPSAVPAEAAATFVATVSPRTRPASAASVTAIATPGVSVVTAATQLSSTADLSTDLSSAPALDVGLIAVPDDAVSQVEAPPVSDESTNVAPPATATSSESADDTNSTDSLFATLASGLTDLCPW